MPTGRIKQGWDHALLGCAPRDPFAGSVPPEKTAVDYSDVYGAPPRRFSGPGHGARSCTLVDGEHSRRWSSSVLDKPLSGGRAGSPVVHRKHLRADFFDDIFRGSTPWRSDLNLFSPSRETAGFTTRISRSSRIFTRNFDQWPSFRSPSSYLLHRQEVRTPEMLSFPSSPIFCAPATPSRLTRIKGYLGLDAHASYRQRPLFVKSAGGSRPPEAGGFAGDTTDETEEQQIKRETDGSTADVGSVPLHFSVYRWARKGVTLLMPSSLRESASGGSRSSPSMEHAELPLGLGEEEVPEETTNAFKKMQDRILVNERASGTNDNFDACLSERVGTGDEGITRRTKGKEDLVGNRLLVLQDVDGAEKLDLQKAGCRPESRAGKPKVNDEVKGGTADCPSVRVDNADEQDVSSCGVSSSRPDTNLKKAELKSPVRGVDVESVDDRSPGGNDTPVSLSDSNIDDVDAFFCNMEELHTENIEEFLVEELSQDLCEDKGLELHQKEIYAKKPDTRIQEWLKGKEGNIRSLLSTLQYVLWPGSGWKPVPLVDIIESSSVRRAYQKALLCLHPDKLQQKGAQAHQKYIAEKVFDTLQEAWDRFNSISSL